MNKRTVLMIIFMAVIAVITNAQSYDSESDFRIDWDKEVRGGVIIAEYLGSKEEIRIPPRIQNLPVTGIAAGIFKGKSITSITIPDNVTRIYEEAFSNCRSLTNVTIG